ncbi:hypothetical protein [Actinomadura rayongensis]|uniref:hypothetical protein n=1 Tax=Actinomadura rayongensis TaxID=1429076 RepID=UPI00192559F9|nr:hypothetical protein [Actinomadura rayongensis]
MSVLIRVGAGCAVAAAMAHDGQVTEATAAFGLGIAAPLVIEKLARQVPLTLDTQAVLEPEPEPPAAGTTPPGAAYAPTADSAGSSALARTPAPRQTVPDTPEPHHPAEHTSVFPWPPQTWTLQTRPTRI